ncbi:MAG: HEPN domain-containing protein [Sedimentisphaerales bacterium]|nr:HEPN domain-containing protein [Sedimentisphaerales bacterium]
MKEFAVTEWRRACTTLDSARRLVESDPDSSGSRSYYAVFHALTAVFALRGQTFIKHGAIRAAFHRDIIKPGLLSVDLGQDYDYLMELREIGDYGGVMQISGDVAMEAFKKAEKILSELKRFLIAESGEDIV